MKKVIDIAKWNKINNYHELKNAGVDGAIVKVINSANSPDGRYAEHCKGLRDADIPIIAGYNYLYANTNKKALSTAPVFMEMCVKENILMPIMDIEDACMTNLGSKIIDIINIYRAYAEQYKLHLGIYTGCYFYNTYIKKYYSEIKDLPFWIARYPSTKDISVSDPVPSTKKLPVGLDIDGWQYSSKCRIPKASNGYIDLSVWYEDKAFINDSAEIDYTVNPYTEPVFVVEFGCTIANDINWVKYNLWLQGMYANENGYPGNPSEICNGILTVADVALIKLSQSILGLEADGKVGNITKSIWKKL